MIVDTIKNASEYFSLGNRIQTALLYLSQTDFSSIGPGRYDIEGNQVFALVETYLPKQLKEGFWEAHKKHLDVQFIVSGQERIGYAPVSTMEPGPYNLDKDFYKLNGEGDFITLHTGQFAILKPQDAHMPGIEATERQQVKKVVIKVRI